MCLNRLVRPTRLGRGLCRAGSAVYVKAGYMGAVLGEVSDGMSSGQVFQIIQVLISAARRLVDFQVFQTD